MDDPGLSQTFRLLERLQDGDEAALHQLLERDLDWVRSYVRRRLGPLLRSRADADDYVQEAMLEALKYGPRFLMSDREQFRALLGRITENVLRDHAARLGRAKRDVARERPVDRDSVLHLDPPQRSVTRPSMAADRNQNRSWVRLAVELLDPEDRELIRMREWDGASFGDIGAHLGVTEDAARMRFARALPRLAAKVEQLRRGEIDALVPRDGADDPGPGPAGDAR